eukprot:Gb_29381 [translate_table: standard]
MHYKDTTGLYHDAACRVIARLKKERDEARAMLAQAERQIPLPTSPGPDVRSGKRARTDNDDLAEPSKRPRPAITPEIIEELADCNSRLSSQRKKRQISPTLAPPEALERYTQVASYPLHKTTKPGILSMDIHPSKYDIMKLEFIPEAYLNCILFLSHEVD